MNAPRGEWRIRVATPGIAREALCSGFIAFIDDPDRMKKINYRTDEALWRVFISIAWASPSNLGETREQARNQIEPYGQSDLPTVIFVSRLEFQFLRRCG